MFDSHNTTCLTMLLLALAGCSDDDPEPAAPSSSAGSGASGSGASGSGASGSGAAGTGASGGSGGDPQGGGGVGGSGGGGAPVETAAVEASWSIELDGVVTSCAASGAGDLQMTFTPEGGGEAQVVVLPCDPSTATTPPLPLGSWSLEAVLLAYTGQPLHTLAPLDLQLSSDGETFVLDPIVFDIPAARFSVSWTTWIGDVSATCDEAGVHHFELLATHAQSGITYGHRFDCPDGQGTAPPWPVGDYAVMGSLLFDQDVVIVSSDETPAALPTASETVTLPEWAFVF